MALTKAQLANKVEYDLGVKYLTMLFNSSKKYMPEMKLERFLELFDGPRRNNILGLGLGLKFVMDDGTLSDRKVKNTMIEVAQIYRGDIPSISALQTLLVKNAGRVDMDMIQKVAKDTIKDTVKYAEVVTKAVVGGFAMYQLLAVASAIGLLYYNFKGVKRNA